ncbi:MAG: glycogen/starch/alpha-glucan phosphorylase [Gammaproteobacteria bacterium]|nr:glycogen/starch/alpha-glucan phosphorylase [Gammaproteobacteria bacterium]MDH4253928.1 glycogen/starch/alpha-glucan phosphorylase [Gammaproteobacteria bacterium]MDH5309353.1 glycogen/starch/alpha-glucan phosphorylase [Gammaproteobacteria bacterium]
MAVRPDDTKGIGDIELLQSPPLPMTADAILEDFTHYFARTLGRRTIHTRSPFLYQSVVLAARDRLMERWNRTRIANERDDNRQVAYLSLEFLMGRLLRNALISLGIEGETAEALNRLGLSLESVCERERDAGLGNGGLGRLAACFLDSCATLKLPVIGYGIRYHYGMFHQRIENGRQVEEPDSWLREGFPWEVERTEIAQVVRFGGRSSTFTDQDGRTRHGWIDTHDVLAIPFDVPIPGYRNEVVNTLRLWSSAATDEFDLEEFNAGSYGDAVAAKNAAENITMVLYPNDATESGKELRLRQQYFLASASLQDTLRRWTERHGENFNRFAEKHCFQLNDTHPAIAVPELMRLLMDEYGLGWEGAWDITRNTMAYTNHTLLPEALEQWPVEMFRRLLPRLLDIVYEINARFLAEVSNRWPGDNDRVRRMSLIAEGSRPMLRMAYLAIVGSYSVNGVAELHSRLLREGLFRDFAELWPDKFNNKTNGVTQRRWLAACNPELAALISEQLGTGWTTDLEQLERLRPLADDEQFQQRWRDVKHGNKARLADGVRQRTGIEIDPAMLFDVQVKRIHEYKRQLLNMLHAVHLYDRIQRGEGDGLTPRAIVIGGKAAPGYVTAKNIIKCINNVARVINTDPAMAGRLRLVFFPDYNVSAMELICPAADLSEQISTAGKEASGTGNMKFMMNGAVTIGTLDGANVEIMDAVGADNFFLFGLTVEQVEIQRHGYDPGGIVEADEDFRRVMKLLESGHFNRFEPGVFDGVIRSIREPADPWMTAADFRAFVDAQQRANDAYRDSRRWTRMSILNTATSGRFSTDRTMLEYNAGIWRLDPIELIRK